MAPHRCGRTECGIRPEASRLTNIVRAERIPRDLSGEGANTVSRMWVGRRPNGPGADPEGKDFTPFLTEDSEIVGGVGDAHYSNPPCCAYCARYGLPRQSPANTAAFFFSRPRHCARR